MSSDSKKPMRTAPSGLALIVWHLRSQRRMSVARLAKKAGLEAEFVERLEKGLEDDKASKCITVLADALGVHVLTLVGQDSIRNEARARWRRAHDKKP